MNSEILNLIMVGTAQTNWFSCQVWGVTNRWTVVDWTGLDWTGLDSQKRQK